MDLFWYFKRFVGMTAQPLPLFFFLMIAAYFFWRRGAGGDGGTRKGAAACATLAALVMLLASLPPVVRFGAGLLEAGFEPVVDGGVAVDGTAPAAIVVLGSGVAFPGEPMMPALTRLSDAARARLAEGVRLSRLYPDAKLITSGHGAGLENCADAMAEAAEELGVDPGRIVRFSDSVDTAHEARLTRELMGDRLILLVTSASHMHRSLLWFAEAGVNAVPATCDFKTPISETGRKNIDLSRASPRGAAVADTDELWHEYLGIAYYRVSRMFAGAGDSAAIRESEHGNP